MSGFAVIYLAATESLDWIPSVAVSVAGLGCAVHRLALWRAGYADDSGRCSEISTVNFFLEYKAGASGYRSVRISFAVKNLARRPEMEKTR